MRHLSNLRRLLAHLAMIGLVCGVSLPARANPLTDFAGQMADQAWAHIETALGQNQGAAAAGKPDNEQATIQPGLNPISSQPRNTRPANALMVSQAGMAALENMRVGASLDVGLPRQEAPTPMAPAMAGLSDDQVREAIVRDHLVNYVASGRCMCPNQPDKTGQPCGRKAGYGKSNKNIAVCYTSQIDQRMVWEWRSAHPSGHS